jgi:hypothetical protein
MGRAPSRFSHSTAYWGRSAIPPATIEDRFLMINDELENKMAVLSGGRAAGELILFEHLSIGAADDLRHVTDIARSVVTRYASAKRSAASPTKASPVFSSPAPIGPILFANGNMPRERRRRHRS